jgi:diguanylate cyclase (GGDEF)-like protein
VSAPQSPRAELAPRARVILVGSTNEDGSWISGALAESCTRRFEVTALSRTELGEAPVGPEAADVVVLRVSDADSIGVVQALVQAHERLPVVVVGDRADEDYAFGALSSGAAAYLARTDVTPRLLATTLVTAVKRHRTIVHLRRAQERALHLVTHDPVTELGNRALFMDRVAQATALAGRGGRRLAVMVLDLGGLRPINETLGHDAGDRLLRETARRIAATVRASDAMTHDPGPDGALITRLGGNEFTILLTEISEAQGAARVARRVLECFARPFVIEGAETYARASLGIAVFPEDGMDADALVRNAHAAMHIAKREGPNCFHFFAESMNEDASRKLELERRLHGALDRNELSVHYQPVRDAASGRLIAAEALLRWNSPELGAVGPGEFIPVAEATGLIVSLGEWVLATACAQVESWRREGLDPIRLSVNLSLHQLQGGALGETVVRILDESGLSAGQLELEITESAFVQNELAAAEMVREIRDRGIGLALDDFGTGYSGLAHLRRFPIDRLKLDHSLTHQITRYPDDAALAAALIAMAHSLRLQVVAEGVETPEQAVLLRESGCDELQGFLFSPAVAAGAFIRFLGDEKKRN